jgi:hypothetical protein
MAEELDLQPNFQRGEIWDLKRRQRLIDTVLREWYVPAIHIVVDSEGDELVLDGQQRLVAIRDFVAGKFRVDGTIDPFDEKIQSLHGLKYEQLPPAVQRAFRRFVIPVITLTDYLPQEPNELFFRLNQAYNLTPPEKRNALHGEARDQVKSLVESLAELGLLRRERIGFSNGRLAYDDIISRACVAIEIGDLSRHINNNVVEDFYRGSEFASSTIGGVFSAGEVLLQQIEAAETRIKFNKGTLQTWLVYSYWAPRVTGALPSSLLGLFEEQRDRIRRGLTEAEEAERRILDVVRVYDDRASYRVTDVSSVLARDLAIHLFSEFMFGTPSHLGSHEVLDELVADPLRPAQQLMADFIDRAGWGESLPSSGLPL